ncbi:hypothetical protein [Natrialba hulunbeirensis]|uniref:hypothetical protein n=1 Tax=Natrialba hulunbeirensis TaxID=123783 RepID=UPI000678295F|nr:hypothetical protein [Natrialba hulunbeirensis]
MAMTDTTVTDPVTISVHGTTLQARDIAGNTTSFGLVGWDRLEDQHTFDEPIDATITGRVSEIRYDLLNMVDIKRLDGDAPQSGVAFETDGESEADGTEAGAGTEAEAEAEAETDSTDPESRTRDADETGTPNANTNIGDDTNARVSVEAGDQEVSLSSGAYVCRFEVGLYIRLRFDASAVIKNRSRGPMTISFEHPTRVTFGFKSPVDYPRDEITVAPTPDGIATALSHLSASIGTTTADRVHRNYRGYPPLLEIDPAVTDTHVPSSVREDTPDTDLEFVVPPDRSTLFVAAPLAYYLGARVRTTAQAPLDANESAPLLRAPSIGLHHEFASGSAFAADVRSLLRRTFFLDLLVSWLEPTEPTVLEYDALTAAGIDLSGCPGMSIAERVQTYLSFPEQPIEAVLPQWPYRMTVSPTTDHVSVLPHLLYDMAAIELPVDSSESGDSVSTAASAGLSGAVSESGDGEKAEEEAETADDGVNEDMDGVRESQVGPAATADLGVDLDLCLENSLGERASLDDQLVEQRRIHGVLADPECAGEDGEYTMDGPRFSLSSAGVSGSSSTSTSASASTSVSSTPHQSTANCSPFVAHPKAYENRLSDLEQQSDERSVVVVFATEHIPESARERIVDTYRRRSDAVSPRVDRVDDPTRVELADVFAAGADFLHYIGDCDEDGAGFACTDGVLSPSALPTNEVGLFQLDAANAVDVAWKLIETGSIAGVAGYRTAASERDLRAVTTVGELLLYGQSLATAHTCATVQTNGTGGVVVGDGTHRFVAKWQPSEIQSLQETDDGLVRGISVPFPVDPVGAHWRGSRSDRKRLIPATITHEVTPDELNEYISNTIRPIYYNGEFYWPEEQKQLLYPIS